MAEMGDGKPRSNNRKRQQMICLRVSPAESAAILRNATRAGYNSAGAFARDLLQSTRQSERPLRIYSGRLAHFGAALHRMADAMAARGQADMATTLQRLSADVAALQRQMFEEDGDAGESDS